jgi:hypothetical protein
MHIVMSKEQIIRAITSNLINLGKITEGDVAEQSKQLEALPTKDLLFLMLDTCRMCNKAEPDSLEYLWGPEYHPGEPCAD